MASWVLIPCLKTLRSEFDKIGPNRDKTTDGSVGDEAHHNSVSDHNPDETGNVPIRDADSTNEVHAIDVDKSGPWLNSQSMEKAVQFLLKRCRSGAEHRLRYIIFNRRIWSASSGWVEKSYTGANPHTEHAHFSASYETAHEASTASWHLEDLIMPTVAEIWDYPIRNPYTNTDQPAKDLLRYIGSQTSIGRAVSNTTEPNPLDVVDGVEQPGRLGAWIRMMEKRRADMEQRLNAEFTELQSTILAAINGEIPTPETLAAAVPQEMVEQVILLLQGRVGS